MAPLTPLMRPDDVDLYRQALRVVRRRIGVPLALTGQRTEGGLVLSEFLGAQTNQLQGLHVESGKGIGGSVLAQQRPSSVNNYQSARTITHDYDAPVLGEGIGAIVAVPVTVRGTVHGVLYAAVRSVFPLGDRATTALIDISRDVGRELAFRDEVDRRLRFMEAATVPTGSTTATPLDHDELHDLHLEFQTIADEIRDHTLRARLQAACARFAALDVEHHDNEESQNTGDHRAAENTLSPREIDVLNQVALGCTNAEAAERLALKTETVKAYLRSTSRKTGVSGRYQLVLAARRRGLIA